MSKQDPSAPMYNPSFVQAYPVDAPSAPIYAQAMPTNQQQQESPQYISAVGSNVLNEVACREYLTTHYWPPGLIDLFLKSLQRVPIRYFICDDSGSMAIDDGKKVLPAPAGSTMNFRLVKCTRWNELTLALQFHAGLANAANAPTEFRMLNCCAPLLIGDANSDPDGIGYRQFLSVLEGSPSGGTPLCRHINEVAAKIQAMAPALRANGQKACVVIATDGESSDGEIAAAMRPLKELPCWVVVRLCTDQEDVVKYWNSVDETLELDMDVLDDLCGEAEEIRQVNPWLTYGEPLHRIREFGIPVKELDLLDEKKLSLDQIRQFATFLFGGKADSYPHPEVDLAGFKKALNTQANLAGKVWCPIRKTMVLWIDTHKISGGEGGFCSVC